MKTTRESDINNELPFDIIAEELDEKPGTVWECHKRALNKLEKILKQKGYTKDDFFGSVKNEH
jgi:hypothetical protein